MGSYYGKHSIDFGFTDICSFFKFLPYIFSGDVSGLVEIIHIFEGF